MSLNNFMSNRIGTTAGTSTPPPPQNSEANSQAVYRDRAFAQGLKVPKTGSANSYGQQRGSHAAQAPSQSSNTHHGSRFTKDTNPQHQHGGRIGLPISDAGSDFEDTVPSLDMSERADSEYGQIHNNDFDHDDRVQFHAVEASLEDQYTEDQSRRGHTISPTKVRRSVPVTTGQDPAGHARYHSEIPIPYSGNKEHNTKKRGRMEESNRVLKKDSRTDEVHDRADIDAIEHEGFGDLLPAGTAGGGFIHSDERRQIGENQLKDDDSESGSERRNSTPTRHLEAEQTPEEVEYRNIKTPINPHSSKHSLDYSENELRTMDYSMLSIEPWEIDREAFTLPDELRGATLGEQVDHYALDKKEDHWANQVAFYQSLNSRQWEEAGDHLLAQIGKLFQEMRDAKKEKRKVLEEIEAEIAAREESVRSKSANIDAKFVAMQAGGEGLLKGKN